MPRGRQRSLSSRIHRFRLFRGHPCPAFNISTTKIKTDSADTYRMNHNCTAETVSATGVNVCIKKKSPNDALSTVKTDQLIRKVDICHAIFITFNIP
jgi:hypothetical protein